MEIIRKSVTSSNYIPTLPRRYMAKFASDKAFTTIVLQFMFAAKKKKAVPCIYTC